MEGSEEGATQSPSRQVATCQLHVCGVWRMDLSASRPNGMVCRMYEVAECTEESELCVKWWNFIAVYTE